MPQPITVPQYTHDGRRLHTFRQSSLKTLDNCMELARMEMSGLVPRTESDAASVGTAFHLGAELVLRDLRDTGQPLPLAAAIEVAQDEFSTLMATPDFRWIQLREGGARAFIEKALTRWYIDVLPRLQPLHMELQFGPLTLYEDSERVIVVTGTIDYIDAVLGILDWKTANRKYERWEYQRWAIQPTVYTWAAHELGAVSVGADGRIPFTFMVAMKKKDVEIQEVAVTRHEGDWEWLRRRALAAARLIEAELPQWPLNDNGWWCSSKWCPVWSACKGATRHEDDNY